MSPVSESQETCRHAKLISVVLPVYNEAEALQQLVGELSEALRPCRGHCELVFVDDGSSDASPALLDELAAEHAHVRVVHLSRNFGHQAAVHAGLHHARGDAVVVMDSDLQDDPAAIPRFVAQWERGYDVVYAIRTQRKEGALKRKQFALFHRILGGISEIPIPLDAGNFGLIDRRVVREILGLRERDRYYPGLRAWVGFRQTGVEVERRARHDDRPRVTMRGLFRLAKTAIFSFSSFPLAIFYVVAAASFIASVGLATFALYHKIFTGLAIPGWTSYLFAVSFFGTLNALGIGILGEYIIRIHEQVRGRPIFLVDRTVNVEEPTEDPDASD